MNFLQQDQNACFGYSIGPGKASGFSAKEKPKPNNKTYSYKPEYSLSTNEDSENSPASQDKKACQFSF